MNDKNIILAAIYHLGFHTPQQSQQWGAWGLNHHQPDQLLPNGEPDAASVYMPVIGCYDSGDPDLIEYHLLLAMAAGLNAFVIHWEGPEPANNPFQNKHFQQWLHTAEKFNFKIAIAISDALKAGLTGAEREAVVQKMAKALRYAQEQYFPSTSYLRLGGHPVMVVDRSSLQTAGGEILLGLTAEEWYQAQKGLEEPVSLVQVQQPGQVLDFSAWTSVYPAAEYYLQEGISTDAFWASAKQARGKGNFSFQTGLVVSGCDNRAVTDQPLVCSRRQGALYSSVWEDTLSREASFIQIASWNDHTQGTSIEPVKELVLHKNAAAPGWGYRELITTREYAVKFRGRLLWPLPALFLPERLYRLRKNGAPARRGDRIRIYLLEGDVAGATLGLEQADV
jgi:hypothetical protein